MRLIKLLTLNTHSLVENDYEKKLKTFCEGVLSLRPDIIALQEVNQSCDEKPAPETELTGFIRCDEKTVVKRDNHVLRAVKILSENGVFYNWTWVAIKKGYGRLDEGIAVMSLDRIIETDVINVSAVNDFLNWKTRKILGIRTEGALHEWFYSVHYGWWNDDDEPFDRQWERTLEGIEKEKTVWLMGDFNNPASVRNEGYDLVESSGFNDSFGIARMRKGNITAKLNIDGWKDGGSFKSNGGGMRIDQIWCSSKALIKRHEVVFDEKKPGVVSDHYGVMIEYERAKR